MWEINNNTQLLFFLLSLSLGCVFCGIYDVLRAYRAVRNTSVTAVFFHDLIYFVFVGFLTFCFLLATTGGEIRFYVILGVLVGFYIFRISVSIIFFKVLKLCFSAIFKAFNWIFSGVRKISKNTIVKFDIFLKNMIKILKKVLKKQ